MGNVDVRPGVRICAHTYINSGRIESDVYIGRYCSIGSNVTLGTGHHNVNLLSTSSWFESDAEPTMKMVDKVLRINIQILNDVWIGDNAIVMNGVTIGNGAVIGAGCIVTRDVPDYAIVIGSPARILRYRFDEVTVQRLLTLRWWELDDELLKEHRLSDIETSLDYLEQLPAAARAAKKEALIRI